MELNDNNKTYIEINEETIKQDAVVFEDTEKVVPNITPPPPKIIFDNQVSNRKQKQQRVPDNTVYSSTFGKTTDEKNLSKLGNMYMYAIYISIILFCTYVLYVILVPVKAEPKTVLLTDAIYRTVVSIELEKFESREKYLKLNKCNMLSQPSSKYLTPGLLAHEDLFIYNEKPRLVIENVTRIIYLMNDMYNKTKDFDFICSFHLLFRYELNDQVSTFGKPPCICLWKPQYSTDINATFSILDISITGRSTENQMVEDTFYIYNKEEDNKTIRKIPKNVNVTIYDFKHGNILIGIDGIDVASITSILNDWIIKAKNKKQQQWSL